jgi:hypothetical protein
VFGWFVGDDGLGAGASVREFCEKKVPQAAESGFWQSYLNGSPARSTWGRIFQAKIRGIEVSF